MDNQNKHSFNIKFEKKSHSLDVETYVKSLTALNTMVKEVNYQTNSTSGEVEIRVIAEKPGSFDVLLEIANIVKDSGDLFFAGVSALAAVVSTVVTVIELKMHLGDKTGEENSGIDIRGDTVNIKDSNGNIVFQTNKKTYNIYLNNQTINDAVSAQFQAVKDDEEIEAVTYHNGNNVVTIKKEAFDTLAKRRTVLVEDSKTSTVPATLVISKLVLDNRNRKWQFVYQGNKINATIADDAFWDRVLSGEEAFANGDRLVCDLEIIRDYDDSLGVYMDRDYIVRNIRDHQKRVAYEQLEL